MKDYEEALQSVRDIFVKVPREHKLIVDSLRAADREIQDLLHLNELGSVDAIGMTRFYKDLNEVQKERRKLKNEIEVLEKIVDFLSIEKPKTHDYDRVIGNVRSTIKKQGRRTYTMRIRNDLQKFVKNKRV